ncbi:MAG: penicillin-binding protein 2 [Nitrospiraceae bacterium]|nr:penicillin-binding protein 2 [Nitrospiraceae bacterium]
MRKRAIILNTAIVFGFVAVFFRLVDLMVLDHQRLAAKANMQQLKSEDIQVRRGLIFDRRGRELGVNVEVESLYCDPDTIASPKTAAYNISKVINKNPKAIMAKFSTNGRFVWIERKIEPDMAAKIKEMDIKGVSFMRDSKRLYPNGRLAAHVIGTVGIDNQALEGVELKYDKFLKTPGGKIFVSRDAKGRILSTGKDIESKGNNLTLTIDEGLQYITEKELDNAMLQWKAKAATAIMMDPLTGEILALANRPSYDTNNALKAKDQEKRNRAITDLYEPGSTFKIIVGTAVLEEKLVNLNTKFDCRKGEINMGNAVIHDSHKNGILTFKEVIQKSSNIGSVMLGMKLGKEKLYNYTKKFGFGEKTGIDLPGEVSGLIRPIAKWSQGSIGSISIGQEVAVTPLQVLRAYSTIANGGMLVTPHVVSEIRTPDGNLVYKFPQEDKRAVISKQTADTFKEILKTVAEEGGTGKSASVKGSKVAGKTGTAQIIDPRTRRYSKEKYVSSFVGFVPADNPRIALIVVVYEPKGQIYGGVVAAPVFKEITKQALSYLNVPEDDQDQKNLMVVYKK